MHIRPGFELRYRDGWKNGFADEQVKIFQRENFAYHKVSVVFWQFDEHDQPAIVTEPYEKAFTAANLKKEQEFYDSDLTFLIVIKQPSFPLIGNPSGKKDCGQAAMTELRDKRQERVVLLTLYAKDNAAKKYK